MKQLDPLNIEKCTKTIKNDPYIKQYIRGINDLHEKYSPEIIYCLQTSRLKYNYIEDIKRSIDSIEKAIISRTEQIKEYYLK